MRTAPLSIGALVLCGCTGVDATERQGHPVLDATIGQILSDPEAWEGKWVRVEGYINDRRNELYSGISIESTSISLDPKSRFSSDEIIGRHPGPPKRPAVASGKVDLTCVRWWQEMEEAFADFDSNGNIFHVTATGELEFCNMVIDPFLAKVVSRTERSN